MSTDRHPTAVRRPPKPAAALALRVVAAAGLAVDAYVHADLTLLSAGARFTGQQGVFLLEAGVALGAALLVASGRRRGSGLFAVLVAASALAAVVTYRYVDLGPIGPLPDIYEPVWYPEKVVSVVGEATALVAAGLLLRRRS